MNTPKSGFSLIELLVAIGVLAFVAAVIIPKFLNVRSQAGGRQGHAEARRDDHFGNAIAQALCSIGATAHG